MRTERQLIDQYLKEIRPFPRLSREEEKVLLAAFQEEKDPLALKRLIQSNLRFVVSVAVKYQHQGLDLLELINEGNLGLLEALKRFNLDSFSSLKFISYAVWWIRQSIIKAIYDKSRLVRAPINKGNKVKQANRFVDISLQKFGHVDYEFIAAQMKISPTEVISVLGLNTRPVSMDAPVNKNEDTDIHQLIPDLGAEAPDFVTKKRQKAQMVQEMVEGLTEKEAIVIRDYFGIGLYEPINLDQISQHLKVSKERVRQIRNRALEKMRKRDFQNQIPRAPHASAAG